MTPYELILAFQPFTTVQTGVMTDKQTETDAGDLIICPMLCNSKGTDNNFCSKLLWRVFYVLHLYRTVADIIIRRTVAGNYKLWL